LLDIIYIIGGFILLVAGGEGVVIGSVSIANHFKLSKLLISAVIIGFGTSLPELVISLQAALQDSPDIALGNVVGSNICNIALVLGVASLIYPLSCKDKNIKRDVIILILASIVLAVFSFIGTISRLSGLVLFSLMVIYLIYNIWSDKRKNNLNLEDVEISEYKMSVAVPISLISIILLIGGGKLLVTGAVSIAEQWGVSQAVIALTIIALGTSLPELAAAVSAARRKDSEVVIGGILGSNLFNILSILGITSMVKPIRFSEQIANQDVWVMLAIAVILLPMVLTNKKIGRAEGGFLLAIYFSYITWISLF